MELYVARAVSTFRSSELPDIAIKCLDPCLEWDNRYRNLVEEHGTGGGEVVVE